jgi:hypothetical protein
MSAITKIFNEQSFSSFEEAQEFFKKAPFCFDFKVSGNLFMMCMSDASDINNEVCRQATGIILEKDTYKLVHHSFPKAYEGFKESDSPCSFQEDFLKIEKEETDTLCIDHYFEGSLIKLYHYNNEWNTATARHLIAAKNRWGSQVSFEKLFADCVSKTYECDLKTFTDSLNPEFCYTFLIQHPDHVMTTNVATPTCFALNKVNLKTLEETLEEKGNLTTSMKTVEEIKEKSKNLTDNYLVYHLDSQGKVKNRVKVLNKEFLNLKEKLGNLPNIGLRYLEKISDASERLFLRSTYSQCSEIFDKVDALFHKAVKLVLYIYTQKYVKNIGSTKVAYRFSKVINKLREETSEEYFVDFKSISQSLQALEPRELAFVINYTY